MILQRGQKVRVLDFLDPSLDDEQNRRNYRAKSGGNIYLARGMESYIGKILTIATKDGSYDNTYQVYENGWFWAIEWLAIAEPITYEEFLEKK